MCNHCTAPADKVEQVRCTGGVVAAGSCPSSHPEVKARKYKSSSCSGDCSSCTSPAGFFAGSAPTCRYADDRYYIFLEGDKCWRGNNKVCTSVVEAPLQLLCE